MPPMHYEQAWLSEYLYHEGDTHAAAGDAVVLEAVEPFVRLCEARGWSDRWFFIRYTERGFHVRVRLHGARVVLEREVAPALREHVASLFPGAMEGYPEQPLDPAGQGVTHFVSVPYVPETARYGGPEGLLLAEDLFHRSSEAALRLLRRTRPQERSTRLGKALLAMLVLVYTFHGNRDRTSDFVRSYGTDYLRTLVRDAVQRAAWLETFGEGYVRQADQLATYVEETWSRLDSGDPLSEALDCYRDDLLAIRGRFQELLDTRQLMWDGELLSGWEKAVAAIVPSYVHMMNNRLGVTIQEESYLAYLIHRTLGGVPAPAGE